VRPVSPYGVAKLASERYLYFYHHEYGIDATCLRYANVYGPRQNPHGEAGVVAIFMHRLLEGGAPVINGDGLQTRDYVFVADVVQANLAVLGRPGFAVYNVGTGVETDVNTLYDRVRKALDSTVDASRGPAKQGEQQRSCISSTLIQQQLEVTMATTFEAGIAATAEWFRERQS